MKSPHPKQILFVTATVGIIFILQGCGGKSPPSAGKGCTLFSSFGNFEGSCTIPDSTTITSECCSVLQGKIDDDLKNGHPGAEPNQQQLQDIGKKCSSFSKYAKKHIPHGDPLADPKQKAINMIKALPDGLTCTEKVKGSGESACELKAKQGKLAVTCEIPKETTITSECCNTIQSVIDKVQAQPNVPPSPQEEQEAAKKCSSVQNYAMNLMPRQPGGAPPNPAALMSKLPSGFSCTETVSSGNMLSMYANRTITSAFSLAAGVGNNDVSDKASVMPSLVSGVVGFLVGGMFVAGVLLRYSKKQQCNHQALLA